VLVTKFLEKRGVAVEFQKLTWIAGARSGFRDNEMTAIFNYNSAAAEIGIRILDGLRSAPGCTSLQTLEPFGETDYIFADHGIIQARLTAVEGVTCPEENDAMYGKALYEFLVISTTNQRFFVVRMYAW